MPVYVTERRHGVLFALGQFDETDVNPGRRVMFETVNAAVWCCTREEAVAAGFPERTPGSVVFRRSAPVYLLAAGLHNPWTLARPPLPSGQDDGRRDTGSRPARPKKAPSRAARKPKPTEPTNRLFGDDDD